MYKRFMCFLAVPSVKNTGRSGCQKHIKCSEGGCGHCIETWSIISDFGKNTKIQKYINTQIQIQIHSKNCEKIGQHSLQGIAVKIKRSLQGSPVEKTHKMLRRWMRCTRREQWSSIIIKNTKNTKINQFSVFFLKITKNAVFRF